MSDPAYALQQFVYELLGASGVADGKVFERVPEGTTMPYVQIGDDVIVADYEAGDNSECTVLVNVIASDKMQLKQLVAVVRENLDQRIEVEGFQTLDYGFDNCRYMTQPDGLSFMAAIEFVYVLQPLT
jgi:hypothetical protein